MVLVNSMLTPNSLRHLGFAFQKGRKNNEIIWSRYLVVHFPSKTRVTCQTIKKMLAIKRLRQLTIQNYNISDSTGTRTCVLLLVLLLLSM